MKLLKNGVRYREIFWNPTDHKDIVGIPLQYSQDAIIAGLKDAEKDYGIIGRPIPSIDREKSPARAVELVEDILAHPEKKHWELAWITWRTKTSQNCL